MAERKLDLPEDLISAKSSSGSLILKGSMGNDVLADMLDDSKDPSVLENTVPLSPQWLLLSRMNNFRCLVLFFLESIYPLERDFVAFFIFLCSLAIFMVPGYFSWAPVLSFVLFAFSLRCILREVAIRNVDDVTGCLKKEVACWDEERNEMEQYEKSRGIWKKDAQFGRTTGSIADVLETSFSDMLKSHAKTSTYQESQAQASGILESSDGLLQAQGSRSNKKKGKKGRHIDPALLGFKVTNNRIMMGEI